MKMHRSFFFSSASHSPDSEALLLKTGAGVYYFPSVLQFALVVVAFYSPQLGIFTASQSANIGYLRLKNEL